jgi:hypothetical protein
MEEPKTHVLAILSIALGVVALILSLPGCICCSGCLELPFSIGSIVTGMIALSQIKSEPEVHGGAGLAYAGFGLSGAAILINLGWIIFAIVTNGVAALL